MNEPIFVALIEQLEALAGSVGFQPQGLALECGGVTPPPDTWTWLSPFALIALVPFRHVEPTAFDSLVQVARNWMARRLTEDERRAKFIDGYLIFALQDAPNGDFCDSVQRVKLDTAICRKHVLWPSSDSDWSKALWGVTALGLPSIADDNRSTVAIPKLPERATHALHLYQHHNSYETAADELCAEARTAAHGKEGNNAN